MGSLRLQLQPGKPDFFAAFIANTINTGVHAIQGCLNSRHINRAHIAQSQVNLTV